MKPSSSKAAGAAGRIFLIGHKNSAYFQEILFPSTAFALSIIVIFARVPWSGIWILPGVFQPPFQLVDLPVVGFDGLDVVVFFGFGQRGPDKLLLHVFQFLSQDVDVSL